MEKIRTLDLFCGAGGCSYGARDAGAEIVAGIDFWEKAAKAFKINFPNAVVVNKDIYEVSPFLLKKEIGDIDLLLASPECTDHSIAKGGKERSKKSKNTAFEVIRFADIFKPKWIVIENVVRISKWSRYDELLSGIRKLGYFVDDDNILNSEEFGVPQSRVRRYILCSNISLPPKIRPKLDQRNDVRSIIDNSEKYKFSLLWTEGRADSTINKAKHAIKSIGDDKPFLIVYYGSGKNGSGGWQSIDEPLRTITTVDRFAYVIPSNGKYKMRMLQPEELKLAMGYRNDYVLDGIQGLTRRDRVKLMGNGVCPPVMRAIVNELIFQWKKI